MVSGSDFERAFHSYYVLFYIVFQSFSEFFIVFQSFSLFLFSKVGKGRDYQWDVSETGGKDEGKDEGKRK
jgi:hypothetical protein